ncbi:hypothetical protein NDU88_000728 [Pleurodeles waltl]|uniref:Uncharacterized protein n=1 Tax=Pleurodeles waltl TaxID=8319 RepID=A0AAV7U4T2_PLEWA|nr:hypothetical protein NDU88_000728 [Pleurodeles waltl]
MGVRGLRSATRQLALHLCAKWHRFVVPLNGKDDLEARVSAEVRGAGLTKGKLRLSNIIKTEPNQCVSVTIALFRLRSIFHILGKLFLRTYGDHLAFRYQDTFILTDSSGDFCINAMGMRSVHQAAL